MVDSVRILNIADSLKVQLAWLEKNMVKVEGGAFMMGDTTEDDISDMNNPLHLVLIDEFYICKYEVTQALWGAVMGDNPSEYAGCQDCPVESVTWYDANKFIEKLNSITEEVYRLPSEAEWEFAAKGGNKSKGYTYAGSNNVDEVAWHDGNAKTTKAVGLKKANELGLHDMSGNVDEWCQDLWHESYEGAPTDGSAWMEENAENKGSRILRGGDFDLGTFYCRTTCREGEDVDLDDYSVGFRLVKSAK